MGDGDWIYIPGTPESRGRKRSYHSSRASNSTERSQRERGKRAAKRKENIAVLDFETDPFDAEKKEKIFPFVCCLYSENFDPVIIWDENNDAFIDKVIAAIEALTDEYTIYAHNGGKFDYMFLIHRIRGQVSFKGRGIMSAKIGPHELRDSFHIIPERLAAYQKEDFDYEKMRKTKRGEYKQEIIDYLISDCLYLYDIVKGFINTFGLKISIGQAAMAELRKFYKVETIGERTDASLREYFYGGRVECLAGMGHFIGDYKLFDVNSMYPFVMAHFPHPISNDYTRRVRGGITSKTVFLEIRCRNFGALVRRGHNNETTATDRYGSFRTTIWEFEAALELDLIDDVEILSVIDCAERSDFKDFVIPRYKARQETKSQLKKLDPDSPEYSEVKKDDIFHKLLLNNAYGKFAQNPRRFKESYITGPNDFPPDDWPGDVPFYECADYCIWQRPSPNRRFNNVGTAASITGASRAVLMRAIAAANDPIYCDTDSVICRDLPGVHLDGKKLGAWDIEDEFEEVIITGKKQYACKLKSEGSGQEPKYKVRSKGVSGLVWADYLAMLDGHIVEVLNKAPTLTKTGQQFYMSRKVRSTAPTQKTTERLLRHAS